MSEVLTACMVAFFGYILYGAAGFGAAMLFHSLWNLLELFGITSGNVKMATYYLNLMTLVVTLVMATKMRKLIQWPFVIVCVIPWTAMNILGTELLVSTDDTILKMILGVFMYIIMVQQSIKTFYSMLSGKMFQEQIENMKNATENEGKISKDNVELDTTSSEKEEQENTPKTPCSQVRFFFINLCKAQEFSDDIPLVDLRKKWLWLVFAGGFGGILSGLYNMPGPSTIIILLFSGIHRERWKANFFAWQIPAQFYVCYYLSFIDNNFAPSYWWAYLLMMLISIFASRLGHWLGQKLSKVTFTFIVISISLLGGSSLLFSGMENKGIIMSVAFLCALVLLSSLALTYYYTVLRPQKKAEVSEGSV